MAIRALFPTLIYQAPLAKPSGGRFARTVADECRALAWRSVDGGIEQRFDLVPLFGAHVDSMENE